MHNVYTSTPGTGASYTVDYYTDGFYGRPKGLRYPGGVGVAFLYNGNGYLVQEKDASSSYVIRSVSARDSRNQVIQASLANGALSQASSYYAATGQLQGITVTGATGTVHDLDYEYDGYGNLNYQQTIVNGATSTEGFFYDPLQRLTLSSRSYPGGSDTVSYGYDAAGNLILKDDYAQSYTYNSNRPNAAEMGSNRFLFPMIPVLKSVQPSLLFGSTPFTFNYVAAVGPFSSSCNRRTVRSGKRATSSSFPPKASMYFRKVDMCQSGLLNCLDTAAC